MQAPASPACFLGWSMAKEKADAGNEKPAQYVVVPTGLGTFRAGDVVVRCDFPEHVTDANFDKLVAIGALVPKG